MNKQERAKIIWNNILKEHLSEYPSIIKKLSHLRFNKKGEIIEGKWDKRGNLIRVNRAFDYANKHWKSLLKELKKRK